MTWSYSLTENYVTQTFIVTIDSSATAGADPKQNIVTFISVSRNDGNRLYFRTFEDKTYEMPPEAVSVLTEQIGVIFDDGTVDDDASVTLDLSQTSLTGLLIDLRFLSVISARAAIGSSGTASLRTLWVAASPPLSAPTRMISLWAALRLRQ